MQTSIHPHRNVPPEAVPIPPSGDDNLAILIAPGAIILYSTVSGTATTLDYETFNTTQDQWYTLRIVCDGSNVTVWRSTEGELESEVLSTSSAAPTTTDAVLFGIVNSTMSNSPFEYDNIRILADDLDNTTAFTVNTANQVTAMNDFNGTTNFAYDPWGRMTKKNVSTTYTANYHYNYGSKMTKVVSDFPGEGTVEYQYGGDQKRRQRTVGGVDTWYNWGIGWNVLNEESGTGTGTLQKTYLGGMAEVAGSDPTTGAYSYYATDNLGSPRAVYDGSKGLVAELNYTPYGEACTSHDTIGITHRYTGHHWDATAALYFAPYRFYSPQIARWMSRDPLGMVDGPNVLSYVLGNPIRLVDRLGLTVGYQECKDVYDDCLAAAEKMFWSEVMDAVMVGVAVSAVCMTICYVTKNPILCGLCIGLDVLTVASIVGEIRDNLNERRARCKAQFDKCKEKCPDVPPVTGDFPDIPDHGQT